MVFNDDDNLLDMLDNLVTLAKFRGTQCNIKYAEAFNVLKIVKNEFWLYFR